MAGTAELENYVSFVEKLRKTDYQSHKYQHYNILHLPKTDY